MKKLFVTIILVFGLLFSAGCGATHYTIHMKSGDEAVAVGKPEYDKASNTVTYKNVDGQKIVIQKDDIDRVIENLN